MLFPPTVGLKKKQPTGMEQKMATEQREHYLTGITVADITPTDAGQNYLSGREKKPSSFQNSTMRFLFGANSFQVMGNRESIAPSSVTRAKSFLVNSSWRPRTLLANGGGFLDCLPTSTPAPFAARMLGLALSTLAGRCAAKRK